MTSYEFGNTITSICAIILSIAIPLVQFLYRKIRKPKLDLLPFDGAPLTLCFNESGSYLELKFSILCKNSGCVVRTVEIKTRHRKSGWSFAQRWTFLKPIYSSWMNAGALQALLNSATYVHPIRIEEDKAEPLYVEFGIDEDEGERELLIERNETLAAVCQGVRSIDELIADPRVKSLVDRIGASCRWQAGAYDIELRVLYDAKGECVRRFKFELSDTEEARLRSNAAGIVTCRLPETLPGNRPLIKPVSVTIKSV